MADEILDIVDSKMNVIGSAPRSVVHTEGLWHQTFHCWVIRREGRNRYVILQRRSYSKKNHPGKLDITAAGHLLSGESVEDGVREIEEEIGFSPLLEDLTYLGIRIAASNVPADAVGKIRNNEYSHVYLWENSVPITEYSMQESEVDSIVEVNIHEALMLFSGRISSMYCGAVSSSSPNEYKKVKITLDDFITRTDRYYEKIFIMAERYFSGKKFLAI